MAQASVAPRIPLAGSNAKGEVTAQHMDRRFIDLMISWSGAVIAVVLLALGAAAIYGGAFAQSNVRDVLDADHVLGRDVLAHELGHRGLDESGRERDARRVHDRPAGVAERRADLQSSVARQRS